MQLNLQLSEFGNGGICNNMRQHNVGDFMVMKNVRGYCLGC